MFFRCLFKAYPKRVSPKKLYNQSKKESQNSRRALRKPNAGYKTIAANVTQNTHDLEARANDESNSRELSPAGRMTTSLAVVNGEWP